MKYNPKQYICDDILPLPLTLVDHFSFQRLYSVELLAPRSSLDMISYENNS